MKTPSKVMLGLSGGVDSAVSACLLLEQGFQVQPVLMHNWQNDPNCSIEDDLKDCQAICNHMVLELDIVNFQDLYRERVFDYCLKLFQQGLTPNPDILCNSQIKFEALKHYAIEKGYDYLATGHYAHVEKRDGKNALICAPDPIKDQTYFLSQLSQEQLEHVIFPLGKLAKHQVRQIADKYELPNATKKDSTGICFIGERRFDHFLSEHLLKKPGDMVDTHGHVIGRHNGLFFYTLGQRRRLGIGGVKHAPDAPWYVLEKDMAQNQIILTQDKQALMVKSVRTEPIHWIRENRTVNQVMGCKLRHGPTQINAFISEEGETPTITFETPQEAPTPGQYLVFYDGDECLGSAMILEQIR